MKKLDTQVSQFEKMLEQFGKVLEFGYLKMIDTVELKNKKIKDHLEANKDTVKLTFERILVILEEAKQKFDFSSVIATLAQYELVDRSVYISDSAGVKDWSFPPDNQMRGYNQLTAITKTSDSEFNFVFKDGKTSDAPMSGQAS